MMSSAAVPLKHSGDRESHSGIRRKPFAFPPESLFAFSPESCSSSLRNRFRVHPGIPFALHRNPHKQILNRWVLHYNHGRVHMSLGPGIPAPLHPSPPDSEHRHRLPPGHRVRRKAVLGGLHHEYWLEKAAA
jgi:hypothetical protein